MANSDNTLETMNLQLIGAEKEEQLIIFNVGDEEFGLDVLRVQEIIRYSKPTKIPHTPTFVEGVIDFRGEVIPVFNMRQRFGIDDHNNSDAMVIIVIEHSGRMFGMTVDRVSDLKNLSKDKLQQRAEFTAEGKTQYLRAMGKLEDRLILILDLEKIIDLNEEQQLDEIISSLDPQETSDSE
ncbi:MAG TPA: chemotaxis protein CheW [Firmicutes bacterium]|nr:chemotaxis protein CheW [Bacillota bacterium]